MKRLLLLLLLIPLLVAVADTLDYDRLTAVIILSEPIGAAVGTRDNLNARVLSVLTDQSYDRDITVKDYLTAHPRERARLERMAMPSQPRETRYSSSGEMLSEYQVSLSGAILSQLLPVTGNGKLLGRLACPCCGLPWPQDKPVPDGIELVPYETGNQPAWTGILIDLRGLKYRPALFPKVVTEEDKEVYGPGFTQDKELAANGMVAHYRTRLEAVSAERIGPNPLVVKALSVTGTNKCDPVVTAYDAARIHGTRANLELLSKCKVGFLVD